MSKTLTKAHYDVLHEMVCDEFSLIRVEQGIDYVYQRAWLDTTEGSTRVPMCVFNTLLSHNLVVFDETKSDTWRRKYYEVTPHGMILEDVYSKGRKAPEPPVIE